MYMDDIMTIYVVNAIMLSYIYIFRRHVLYTFTSYIEYMYIHIIYVYINIYVYVCTSNQYINICTPFLCTNLYTPFKLITFRYVLL